MAMSFFGLKPFSLSLCWRPSSWGFPSWTELSPPPCPYFLLIYLFSFLWSSWTVSFMETDDDNSCFVLFSFVRRKPRVDTFSESRDVEWDHSGTGVMGGMAWGRVRFPSPHCVSVCLIQSKNWRGSRLNSSDCWMIPSILSKLGAYNWAKVETQGFNLGKSGGDRCRGRRVIQSVWPKC